MKRYFPKALLLPALFFSLFAANASAQNTLSISSSTSPLSENAGSAAIVVQVHRASGDQHTVTVNFSTSDGSAVQGSDYLPASGTLTFAPNETAKMVQVSIINDFIPEPTESFHFTLSGATNATITTGQAEITINDDDGSPDAINRVEFSSANYGAVETQGAIFLVLNATRRGDPNQTLMVSLNLADGTAQPGTDYSYPSPYPTITFPPGTNQVIVTVPISNRSGAQGDRFFSASLIADPSDPFTSVGPQDTARATIFDNSGPNTVRLLSNAIRIREGDQESIAIPVFRTGDATTNTNVNFTTEIRSGDTAQAGVNFTPTSGTITFTHSPIQYQAFIVIPILDNSLSQGDVTFHVTLTSSDVAQLGPVNTTQVTIEDDDAGSVVQFSTPNYSVSEAGGYAVVKVKLTPSGDPSQASVVDFVATSITAFSGFDFSPISTTLVFQPGEFSKTVLVPIFDDSITEPTETFRVTLSNPGTGTVLGAQSTAIVSILDNDLSDVVQFSPSDYSVAENGTSVRLTVVANRANNPEDVITVHYKTLSNTASAGNDFVGVPSGTLVLGAGETQKTITINVTDDSLIEGAEDFFVVLTDASAMMPNGQSASADIGTHDTATVTILDDDSPEATIGFAQDSYDVEEGAGFANLTITRSGGLGVSATVKYSTTDGTAVAGVNYVASSGDVTFAVGQVSKVIKIPIIDGATADPTLDFTVTLTAADGTGFVGGRSTATVNINDNDATTFRFDPDSYTVDEGSGTVTLTVEALRVGDPNETISVDYVTSDGTARAGSNYTRTSGRLTFGPNMSAQTITVPIIDNSTTEGTTAFSVTLSNPLGDGSAGSTPPRLASPSTATVTIIDNDATTFQFSSPTYTANDQSGVANATITLSRIGDPNKDLQRDLQHERPYRRAGPRLPNVQRHAYLQPGGDLENDQRPAD